MQNGMDGKLAIVHLVAGKIFSTVHFLNQAKAS